MNQMLKLRDTKSFRNKTGFPFLIVHYAFQIMEVCGGFIVIELFNMASNRLKTRREKIYFTDSTHPQHNAIISYGWIKKGEDFEIQCNFGRDRLNIKGSVEIENLDVITRICDG